MFDQDVWTNENLLTPFTKWKVLGPTGLLEESGYSGKRKSLLYFIQRLEKRGILKSTLRSLDKLKIIYPTPETFKILRPDKNFRIFEESLYHDFVASNVARHLMMYKQFKSIDLPHEYIQKNDWKRTGITEPDAIFNVENKSGQFNMALEIEISQKAKNRIDDKFLYYRESKYFQAVLYIFSNPRKLQTYREVLEKEQSAGSKKILLALGKNLSREKLCMGEWPLYVAGKEKKLAEVIFES